MQIRRCDNSLFPRMGTNTISNSNGFLSMIKAKKEDVSATMTISKAGREMARMLEEPSKNDDYMKNAESKIDKILDTIRDGGTLSKEEEELVNNELKNISEKKYKDYRDLRLKPEEVLMELKDNYLRREKLFFDMQEQLEAEAIQEACDADTEKIMAYMQEKENDEEIIEMVKEYGEDEEEKSLEESSEDGEKVEKEANQQEINLKVGNESTEEMSSEDTSLKMMAMKKIEDIENQMSDVEEANAKSRQAENAFAKRLEEDYERFQRVLNSDEVSTEDKLKAYDRFTEEAYASARGREVERIKKEFDIETLMMAKITFLGQNGIDDMINGDVEQGQMGTDFIKSFLVK